MERMTKDEYYLKLAGDVSGRSTCLKRKYGAIIVKDDHIVSTGYNGAPRGCVNCCDTGTCHRMHVEHNTDYASCSAIHAEQNAIIHASYSDMKDATLYLVGFENDSCIDNPDCCDMCKRFIINAGINKVVFGNSNGVQRTQHVFDWIAELDNKAYAIKNQTKQDFNNKDEYEFNTIMWMFKQIENDETPISDTFASMYYIYEWITKHRKQIPDHVGDYIIKALIPKLKYFIHHFISEYDMDEHYDFKHNKLTSNTIMNMTFDEQLVYAGLVWYMMKVENTIIKPDQPIDYIKAAVLNLVIINWNMNIVPTFQLTFTN